MIISYEQAFEIDKNIDQEKLDSIETSIRNRTNNNFHNTRVRFKDVVFIDSENIGVDEVVRGLKQGDTIEVNYSGYNDGLYVVESVDKDVIGFKGNSFDELDLDGAMITKVEYPADVKQGVKEMLKHDLKSKDKTGIKSESISRWSVTYSDNEEGYPSEITSFLNNYSKMRW